LFAIGGCGDAPAVPLYPASGRVLVDGRTAAGVEVRLHPADRTDDLDAAVPFAATGEDGGFRLGTKVKGDGAPAGRYRATLTWPDGPPGPSPRGDLLGGRYRDAKSGIEVTIAAGDNAIPPFEVKKAPEPALKRPASKKARPDTDAFGP
jgi:hypothetical protein